MNETGTLYVVGTPIGNLSDVTKRQLDTLSAVDFIAAEDTRVTRKLLSHFDLHTPLVSYHDHSTRLCAEGILSRLLGGESAAIVTDAGMPCISDPGEELVRMCYEKDIPVRVIPGPSAVISALAVSGLPTGRFSFEGFLPVEKKERQAQLELLRFDTHTLIFYEAPHKLLTTLRDLRTCFGGDRRISLCRELTKIYEEVLRLTLDEALRYYETLAPKGEYVLIVEGAPPKADAEPLSLEEALSQVKALMANGERAVDACKAVAKESGLKKSALYAALVNGECEPPR